MTKLRLACLALLAALLAAPAALAQNETNNYDVDLNPGDGDDGNDAPQEAAGWFGMSTTVVVVLLILAVLVIALVVAVASRGRDLP